MLETIKQIRELAIATENTYLLHKISILEIQIQGEIKNAEIELLKKYI